MDIFHQSFLRNYLARFLVDLGHISIEFPLNGDPRVGIFLEPLNTNDRFFFSYTTTVRYSTVYYLLVTSLRSMFIVDDARCKNQLEQRINSALNNGQMVISSKWIYKN